MHEVFGSPDNEYEYGVFGSGRQLRPKMGVSDPDSEYEYGVFGSQDRDYEYRVFESPRHLRPRRIGGRGGGLVGGSRRVGPRGGGGFRGGRAAPHRGGISRGGEIPCSRRWWP
jgi:hypothetical protein